MNLTWTSPVFPKLAEKDNPVGHITTDEENSWIGSLLTLGAVFGPFVWGFLADSIGRKYTLLVLSVPFSIAYIILAFGNSVVYYYVARFIAGISLGGLFIIIPMYIVEICDKKQRGMLSSAQNLFVTTSSVFAYAVGPYINILALTLICFSFTVTFIILGFFFLTETPYYLIKKKRYNEAEESMKKYKGSSDSNLIKDEIEQINTSINSDVEVSLREVFQSKSIRKGFLLSLALMLFQQFSGINVILFNTQTIFSDTKSSIPDDMSSLFVGITSLVFAIISNVLVDKLGRKILFIVSGIGMFVSDLLLGIYFYMMDNGNDVDSIFWLPILSLLMYIGFYNFAFGPLPWVVLAEVLPDNVKNKLSPFASSFCWILGFVITKFYSTLANSLHLYGAFWLFSGFNAFAALFSLFMLPETKGKTLQEIQLILSG